MRGLYLGLTLAGILFIGRPAAGAESLATCAPPSNSFDKQVCADSDLRELAAKIGDQADQLRRRYQGEDRRVFDVEYKRWRYNTYLCMRHKGGEHDCLRENFDDRLKLLADLASGSKDIQEVAASYFTVEPWYVNELPKQYEGRAVYAFGNIYLRGCDDPGMPRSALIRDPPSRAVPRPFRYAKKEDSIEMRFDRIQDYVKGRTCEKKAADLTGTVMLDHGKPYIYVPELF